MKAVIKKSGDFWKMKIGLVESKWESHDEAVKYAYKVGVTDFTITYSPNVSRHFDRTAIENFVLKGAKV